VLELVARSGARLVGLDFAPAAIDQARANAQQLGLADRADLRVGDMTATGLDPASVTAVLCVDAAQFPPDVGATFTEAHRVLATGRRAP
jgi:ubiquinone/menaquinone biosynthesis C-methylase UbiE